MHALRRRLLVPAHCRRPAVKWWFPARRFGIHHKNGALEAWMRAHPDGAAEDWKRHQQERRDTT